MKPLPFEPGEVVRCLSVRQPFAEQIATGEKPEEYRSWSTKYRGPLLIVSALTTVDLNGEDEERLPRGVAVCFVELVDLTWTIGGDWAWQLRRPARVKPFAVKGKLGLFRLTLPTGFEMAGRSVATRAKTKEETCP